MFDFRPFKSIETCWPSIFSCLVNFPWLVCKEYIFCVVRWNILQLSIRSCKLVLLWSLVYSYWFSIYLFYRVKRTIKRLAIEHVTLMYLSVFYLISLPLRFTIEASYLFFLFFFSFFPQHSVTVTLAMFSFFLSFFFSVTKIYPVL